MALARRHVLPAINEPLYEINDVPRAKYTGQNSTSKVVSKRDEWLAMLGEAVLTSNRAEEDFERKLRENGDLVLHPGKPLSLEYLADRIDTDDPLWGYTVRTTQEGWMQGYITLTTFTTWLKWFRFDSLCEAASVLPYARTAPGTDDKVQRWWDDRVMDGDGRLARALNRQIRDGDWTDEGVIWPRVAEVSLLAGLGCGGLLLDAALEELYDKRDSAGDRQYEYVVVQATENAVPFYESRGFIRVGAIARYEERGADAQVSPALEEDEDEVYGKKSKKAKRAKAPSRSPAAPTSAAAASVAKHDGDGEEELTGTWSPITQVKSIEGDTPKRLAKRLPGVRASDVVFLNRRMFGDELHEDALLIPGTVMRVPVVSKFDQRLHQTGAFSPVEPLRMKVGELREACCASPQHAPGTQSGMWYSTLHEGIPSLSRKFNVSPSELVALNKARYPELKVDSNLHPGSMLLLPGRTVDLQSVYALAQAGERKDALTKDEVERRKEEQRLIREEAKDAAIQDFYCATTTANSTSTEGVLTKRLSDVMAYRHWTFPDEPAKLTSPSYMMALPLNKRYLDKHVPSFQSGQSALAQLQQMSTRECLAFPRFDYRVDGGAESAAVAAAAAPSAATELPPLRVSEETAPVEEESHDAVFCESALHVRVAIKGKVVERWRALVGEFKKDEGGDAVKLFCKGGTRTRRVDAVLSRPLQPRPPVAPTIPLAPLREYVRQVRPDVMREHPHLSCGEAVRVCETSWKQLDEEDRQVYTKLACEQRDEYRVRMRQYLVDLARYHKQFGLDSKLYDLTDPDHPVLRSAAASALVTPLLKKLKHSSATGGAGDHNVQHMLSVDALGPGYRKLMNKVVTLKPKANEESRKRWLEGQGKPYHQPSAEYYYTLTYIPDLQWCRLVPLKRCGLFHRGASRKKDYERHVGRVKWMLAPESEGGEIDVSAERCVPVWKAYSTKNVQDADKEEWDVYDTDPKLNGLNLDRAAGGGYYGANGGALSLELDLTAIAPTAAAAAAAVVAVAEGMTAAPVFEFEPAPPMLLPPMD